MLEATTEVVPYTRYQPSDVEKMVEMKAMRKAIQLRRIVKSALRATLVDRAHRFKFHAVRAILVCLLIRVKACSRNCPSAAYARMEAEST